MSAPHAPIVERVRWSDVDRARIVYFGKYLRWLEAAEAEFFRACGVSYDELEGRYGILLARVHLEMDFRKPAVLDDELTCWAELERIGGSSLRFTFPVERSGERIVDIVLVLACLDAATMRPVRVPPEVADALRPAVIAERSRPEA